MRPIVVLVGFCLAAVLGRDVHAQRAESGFGFSEPERGPCLSAEDRDLVRRILRFQSTALASAGLLRIDPFHRVDLDWPLRAVGSAAEAFDVHAITNFVDLDARSPGFLKDYACGTRTYDLASGYDHQGIDFSFWPFKWTWMDADEIQVVAAAPGTILFKSDGNLDENCSSGGGSWNAVYVQHLDGSVAWYGHLKNGSPTPKPVGDVVATGEVLGVAGSSGNSTGVHLHFELYDRTGKLTDPFDGPCNNRSNRSWWRSQRTYYDTGVNLLQVGDAPVQFPACPGRAITNEVQVLPRGTPGYFTAFFRERLQGQLATYTIRRPDGTAYGTWTNTSSAPFYTKSWWWWSRTILPSEPTGTWTFEVDFEGRVYAHPFEVS